MSISYSSTIKQSGKQRSMSVSLPGRNLYRVNVHVDCHQPEEIPADVRARDLIKFLVLAKPEDKISRLKKDVVEELKSFPRS